MNQWGPWSSNSQEFTRLCILESQLQLKDNRVSRLEAEKLVLTVEIERLQNIVKTLLEKTK